MKPNELFSDSQSVESPKDLKVENPMVNQGNGPENKINVIVEGERNPIAVPMTSAVHTGWDSINVELTGTPQLPECPDPGSGVHTWIMSAAWSCRTAGIEPSNAMTLIEEMITRQPQYREIENAVEKVYECESLVSVKRSRPIVSKYKPDIAMRLAEKLPNFTVADLSARSPVDPEKCSPADYLAHLYRQGEKVLIFKNNRTQGDYLWVKPPDGVNHDPSELDGFRNIEMDRGVLFLCNPVCGDYLEIPRLESPKKPSGRSRRCEECMTAFPYLLLESDLVDPGIWIRCLAQLPLPIASVTTSGGRSLHALLHVDAETSEEWHNVKNQIAEELVTLGADSAAMTCVRLTRLPGCFRREKDAMQTLLYINPKPDGTPIAEQPRRIPTVKLTPSITTL